MRLLLSLIIALFVINSCGSVKYSSLYEPKDSTKVKKLSKELYSVGGNKKEADELAVLAIKGSRELANRYNLVSPPQYHNFLVNSGQRERGLCFHFVEDLMKKIKQRDFKSFKFRWGRANADKLNEHNVIVVTGNKDSSFENGVILDAWRDSGELFFTRVKDDKEYNFVPWSKGDERIKNIE